MISCNIIFLLNLLLLLLMSLITMSYGAMRKDPLVNVNKTICDISRISKKNQEGMKYHYGMLLDEKHHIIMDWTPKAACTKAVEMFWNEMGIYRGVHYPQDAFVHNYRKNYEKVCGSVTKQMFNSNKYYKFKVVRNPYNRAVSSYLHIMKNRIGHKFANKNTAQGQNDANREHPWNNLSFEEFLRLYITTVHPLLKNDPGMRNSALIHFQHQCLEEEVTFYNHNKKSIFNRIVHAEKFDEDISLVNGDTRMNYSYPIRDDPHVAEKSAVADIYLGNHNYTDLLSHHQVPNNYGKFYNNESRKLVAMIFSDDLKLYGYDYPFDEVY